MSNTWNDRVAEAEMEHGALALTLYRAGRDAGYSDEQVHLALQWTAIQLDPENDDYEVWEATLLARLEDPTGTGER